MVQQEHIASIDHLRIIWRLFLTLFTEFSQQSCHYVQMHVTGSLNPGQFYENDFTEFSHIADKMSLSGAIEIYIECGICFHRFILSFFLFLLPSLTFSIGYFVHMHARSKVLIVFVFSLENRIARYNNFCVSYASELEKLWYLDSILIRMSRCRFSGK